DPSAGAQRASDHEVDVGYVVLPDVTLWGDGEPGRIGGEDAADRQPGSDGVLGDIRIGAPDGHELDSGFVGLERIVDHVALLEQDRRTLLLVEAVGGDGDRGDL